MQVFEAARDLNAVFVAELLIWLKDEGQKNIVASFTLHTLCFIFLPFIFLSSPFATCPSSL